MAAILESAGSSYVNSNTTKTAAFSLGTAPSTTRAVIISVVFSSTTQTGIGVTVGTDTATLITGTDTTTSYSGIRSMLFGCVTALTGSQNIVISWTGSGNMAFSVASYVGVDQTTPFTNGTFTGSASAAASFTLAVTSRTPKPNTAGDRTFTAMGYVTAVTPTSNQDLLTSISQSAKCSAGMGAGAGSDSHTWTAAFAKGALSGCNIVAAADGGPHITLEARLVASAGSTSTGGSIVVHLGPASTTRAVLLSLGIYYTVTGLTVTLGGVPMNLITGTNSSSWSQRTTQMYGLVTALTGPQTITAAWTNGSPATYTALAFTGVNATTPFNNGATTGHNSSTAPSIAITSVVNDLTTSVVYFAAASTDPSSSQVLEVGQITGAGGGGKCDIGPGTGTSTHTWTATVGNFTTTAMSGCNVVQAPIVGNLSVF